MTRRKKAATEEGERLVYLPREKTLQLGWEQVILDMRDPDESIINDSYQMHNPDNFQQYPHLFLATVTPVIKTVVSHCASA